MEQKFLENELFDKLGVLSAFAIKQTKTMTDDEILINSAEIASKIEEKLQEMVAIDPTLEEVAQAIIWLLERLAKQTHATWDDKAVSMIKTVLNIVF